MIKHTLPLLFLFLGFLSAPAAAQDALIMTGLAEDRVDITTGFNGAHISLFGTVKEPGDVAVVITGPQRDEIVRKKHRVLGVWMNTESVEFENVPAYYDFALSAPAENIAAPEYLKIQGIGFPALDFETEKKAPAEEIESFEEALLRNKTRQGFFPEKSGSVVFLSDNFFRADFYIPANVATGLYKIRTFLFKNGQVRDKRDIDIRVAQMGTNAAIYDFAQDKSLLYGILSVFFALSVGWLSNVMRQKR